MQPDKMIKAVAGVDIGGTNIVIGLVSQEGNVIATTSVATGSFPTAEEMVASVSQSIENLCKTNTIELMGVGIGAPNGNFYTGAIEFAPNLIWKGIVPLAKMFEEKLQVDALLTNDANAAAIGEQLFGAAKGMKNFILVTLGTGLGSGFVVNGEIVYGHDGFAGELGHVIAQRNGRPCGCGRRGCLETYCSATGIVRTINEWLKDGQSSSLSKYQPDEITAAKICMEAMNGDALALEAFNYTGKILGETLADAIAYTSPEAIILFGGLANAGELIFAPTKISMEENLLQIYKGKVKLLPSKLAESDVAVLGAASLIWQRNVG